MTIDGRAAAELFKKEIFRCPWLVKILFLTAGG
jgi:hypothetical protein